MQSDRIPRTFATTHWTVVLSAKDSDSPQSEQAMASLCETYWYPLYAFVRRSGYSPHEAEDLTQGFFARFLEKRFLDSVDRRLGRFRSFMLAAIKHYLADQHDKATALKRGGGRHLISLDAQRAEEQYGLEPAHDLRPDKLFERRWAASLLSQVFDRLSQDYAKADKASLFRTIEPFLSPASDGRDYRAAAEQLDMKEGAVRMAVHRMRKRYGELFREEVANTVSCEEEIEDEMRQLREILSE